MQLHELKRKTPNKRKETVGRGGKRGKTSGRGGKGQTARAGSKMRPELRDIIKRIPKRRGHGKNRARTVNDSVVKATVVNLEVLNEGIKAGTKITPEVLVEMGIVKKLGGKMPKVKILGTGEITKAVSVEKCFVSAIAKEKIIKAGGSVA
jgi:large subunit ribosomal protein L15